MQINECIIDNNIATCHALGLMIILDGIDIINAHINVHIDVDIDTAPQLHIKV